LRPARPRSTLAPKFVSLYLNFPCTPRLYLCVFVFFVGALFFSTPTHSESHPHRPDFARTHFFLAPKPLPCHHFPSLRRPAWLIRSPAVPELLSSPKNQSIPIVCPVHPLRRLTKMKTLSPAGRDRSRRLVAAGFNLRRSLPCASRAFPIFDNYRIIIGYLPDNFQVNTLPTKTAPTTNNDAPQSSAQKQPITLNHNK
jgi:hypothetical protein